VTRKEKRGPGRRTHHFEEGAEQGSSSQEKKGAEKGKGAVKKKELYT